MTKVVRNSDLQTAPGVIEFEGAGYGSGVSFYITENEQGAGPGLHRHPYPETFILLEGNAAFTVDGKSIAAATGSVIVVPANTPHRFVNAGPGSLHIISIHPSSRFQQEDIT